MKTFLFEMDKAELKGGGATRLLNETMKNIFEMDIREPGLRIKGAEN